MSGPKFYNGVSTFQSSYSPSFWGQSSRAFVVDRGGSLIVCDGGDCRCEASFQSYSPSNVEVGLQNDNFWVLGVFAVGGGRDLLPINL